ncbi:DUF6985 domain-containing protein [Flavobacterium sp. N2038]|uniref:DUF6985 domain-containing protein n=1 Tax=Flavobacterium sp. N2038 TaxID=2986829 RepID=UPI002224D091|nr:hypothetical protein [Flavobacterium sp. N2038]
MRISEYISTIEFDTFKLYYREFKPFEAKLYDFVDYEQAEIRNDKVLNSIVDNDQNLNLTFTLIASSTSKDELLQCFPLSKNAVFPKRKNAIYNIAILFKNKGILSGGLNIDIRDRIASTINNKEVLLTNENSEKLIELFSKYSCQVSPFYLPPSIPVGEIWRNYEFPFEFFYNPAFETFEARINSGIMCLNFTTAKVEFEVVDNNISAEQIKRIHLIEGNKYKINETLSEYFWESYNQMRGDYGLPELTDIDQLKYFVRVYGFIVPIDEEGPIIISFRTWDEEHGQAVYYYNESRIEFE